MPLISGRLLDDDRAVIKARLSSLPIDWDGKNAITTLKAADFQWRQMEWFGFYFEFIARQALCTEFEFPGERIGRTPFDMRGAINWDLKSSAIKSHNHHAILNDCADMEESAARHGRHGVIMALCDVEYNDSNRSFQQWHEELKGVPSNYVMENNARNATSRYRKTKASLVEILLLCFSPEDLQKLQVMRQGRNSNGRSRRPKYMLDIEHCSDFEVDRIVF